MDWYLQEELRRVGIGGKEPAQPCQAASDRRRPEPSVPVKGKDECTYIICLDIR